MRGRLSARILLSCNSATTADSPRIIRSISLGRMPLMAIE